MELDPFEFQQILRAVGDDVQGFSLGWYDTPFYNVYGNYTGKAYLNGRLYDRSALNYIGEGEALARIGFSRDATQAIVWTWKNALNIVGCAVANVCRFRDVSQGVKDMADIGGDYYAENYDGAPYPEPAWP
jgi:hypothetical protein